jgi:hypothetical protein
MSYLSRPLVVEHLSRPSLPTDVGASAHICCISLILYVEVLDGSKPSALGGRVPGLRAVLSKYFMGPVHKIAV